ncbi:MAG: hypothetical protein HYU39_02960 [Thaumarchaeota archaeon]|nr:hypothetical protein [Nitrososphaerota archaeon]
MVIGLGFVSLLITVLALTAGSAAPKTDLDITLIKEPTCDCCSSYARYLEQQGFKVKVVIVQDLQPIKESYRIPQSSQSCHTSTIGNYFVEGHVPVEAIKKLLAEKPSIDGITLPHMPPGAPGMPGVKVEPFKIYMLREGRSTLFTAV